MQLLSYTHQLIEKYYQTPLNKDTFEIKLDLPVNSDNIIDLDYILMA